jgi:1-acyl-sn-glycerol-3-phosphate acyltransferase
MEFDLRPARDFGLTPARRLRSPEREPGLIGVFAHWLWTLAIRAYLAAFHHLRVSGRENLPAEAPFVMIANHASYLDTLALTAALPLHLSRVAYALAAGEVFFSSLRAAGFAALAVNALPLWRKRTSERDLAFLRTRLEEDRVVFILFPEGTRTRTGEMAAFRQGLGALVAGGAVPVVPCFISGAFAAWPPHRRLPRPRRLALVIGAPLTFAEAGRDRHGWAEIAAACEARVRALDPSASEEGRGVVGATGIEPVTPAV